MGLDRRASGSAFRPAEPATATKRAPHAKKPFGNPKGFFLSCLGDYTENEEPQPQVVLALGLRMTNCAPSRSSL